MWGLCRRWLKDLEGICFINPVSWSQAKKKSGFLHPHKIPLAIQNSASFMFGCYFFPIFLFKQGFQLHYIVITLFWGAVCLFGLLSHYIMDFVVLKALKMLTAPSRWGQCVYTEISLCVYRTCYIGNCICSRTWLPVLDMQQLGHHNWCCYC